MDVCGATENGLFGTTGLQNIEILDFRGVDGDPRVRADSTVKCGALGLLKIRHQFRSAEGRNGCESTCLSCIGNRFHYVLWELGENYSTRVASSVMNLSSGSSVPIYRP